jgi:hypothetical protein
VRVTIDTNVLYQALRDNRGASYFILTLVEEKRIELALSTPVFVEYSDVLLRDKSISDLSLSKKDINLVLDFLANYGLPQRLKYRLGLRHIPLCHFDCRAISCQVLWTRGTSASLFVMCNGLNVVYDGSSDHGAVRRGHGSKKEKKGSGRL